MSVMHITKENFQQEVMESTQPVLLDFWAEWCGPCQMVAPLVEEIAQERSDVKVGKVNVDDERELAMAFGVASIPTLVLMQEGKVVRQSVGARPKSDLLALLP